MQHSILRTVRVMMLTLVALCLLPATSMAQTKEISGVVSNQQNVPVAGAIVMLKNASDAKSAVVTNADGQFTINAKPGSVLVIKHLEYLTREEKVVGVTDNKPMTIHLFSRFVNNDKAYTDAYGNEISADENLGATSTVYRKDLEKYLASNLFTGVQGRIPGLDISQVRGTNSHVTANNTQGSVVGSLPAVFGGNAYGDNSQFTFSGRGLSPVIMVDGIERDIVSLDPEAIESITYTKDALSSMFLGMKSSRGALIINTKTPTKGKMAFSFTGKFGVSTPIEKLHPLRADQYAFLLNEALQNDGKPALYDFDDYKLYGNGSDPYLHPAVDWQSQLMKNKALNQSYNMNVSGGNDRAQYFISLGYYTEEGLFRTDPSQGYNTNLNFNRYLINSKVNIKITDDFTATMTAMGRVEEGNQPGTSYTDLLSGIFTTASNAYPVKNPNGTWGGNVSNTNNLLAKATNSGYMADNARDIMASLRLHYDFNKVLPGLSAYALASVAAQSRTATIRTKQAPVFFYTIDDFGMPVYAMYGESKPQSNDFRDVASYRYLYGQLHVDYQRQFGMHSLKASVVGDTRHELNDYNLPMIPSNVIESVEYDYGKRYFAQVKVAESYYNRYAPNRRWGTFAALGLGWDISKENFMADVNWLDKLKLRGVLGRTGNGINNSGYYCWEQTFSEQNTGYYAVGTSQGKPDYTFVMEGALANPYITWEKANKVNLGIDMAFLGKRLEASIDYFNDKYFDLLQQRGKNIATLGIAWPEENIGKVRRYGAEISLTWQDHVSDFNYYVSANWSTIQDKLLFKDEQQMPYDRLMRTGKPTGTYIGLRTNGFLTAEDIANGYPVMKGYDNIQAGDLKYIDLNNDGQIDEWDLDVIGGNKALAFFGLDLGFEWKGIELSMFWQGTYNRDIYINDATLIQGFQNRGQSYGQAYENLFNRWTPETAATATYPRLSAGGNAYNMGGSYAVDLYMRSGNYLRLKNISVAYNLPEAFCRKALGGLRAKVFVNAQNMLTFSGCDLRDPEVSFVNYPIQKCVFTGVNLKF